MGFFKTITKKLKIKTQFIVFFLSTSLTTLILSVVFVCLFLSISFNKKIAFSNEAYVLKNVDKILNTTFKSELDSNVLKNDFNYWVVSKDNTLIYSSIDSTISDKIPLSSKRYIIKKHDKASNKTIVFVFTPLFINNELSGGFVQKYVSNFFIEFKFVDNFTQKIGYELSFNLFIIIIIVLINFIVLVLFSLIFSSCFKKSFKEIITISNKIRNGRLDFAVDSSYKNEIGDVLLALDEMRITLDDSLKTQWLMAEQRKDMILSLTHDIKTPITIIYGHLELLSGNYHNISDTQKESYIKILLNNAEKVKTLINQLNEVWDLERPNLSLNIQEVNLSEFISYLEDNFSCLCNEKNIKFILSHSFADDDYCKFDAFRIEETLLNLISNSLKHTTKDDKILIESFFDNNSLTFKVSDTGNGFKDTTDIIFNKHYKGNEDIIYKNSSGLGLYICKLIIEKHNGSIRAYNNNTGGATVEFSLPLL